MNAEPASGPKTLTRQLGSADLLIFGLTNILGSGAANLTGPAVLAAGKYYPAVIGGIAALLLGSSRTFSVAIDTYKANNSASQLIHEHIGRAGQVLEGTAYLSFNLFAVALGLVFITRIFFHDKSAWFQMLCAIQLAVVIIITALYGIDINARIVDYAGAFFMVLLGGVGVLGLYMATAGGMRPQELGTAVPRMDLAKAALYVFFILAGFDVLMTFTEESKDSQDVVRGMYGANILSALLLLGAVFAFVLLVPLRGRADTLRSSGNFLADIVEQLWGRGERVWMNWLVAAFILLSCFIQFVGASRWFYSTVSEVLGVDAERWRELNARAAPHKIILLLGIVVMGLVLINNVDRLVGLADMSLIAIMGMVGWAATRHVWDGGERVPWAEGGTTVGLLGLLGIAVREVWRTGTVKEDHELL